MSDNASTSHARPESDEAAIPARRQRLVEEDFGEPDVLLVSDDNVEYPAHRSILSATCALFSDIFQLASSDAVGDDVLPRIPLLADSATIEMVLPLAYRKSAANLRSKAYAELDKGIQLAHRLGMPLVVDTFAIYLEAHISEHGFHLFIMARTLGLSHLEGLCEKVAESAHDLALPNRYLGHLGKRTVEEIHQKRIDKILSFSVYIHERGSRLKSPEDACAHIDKHHKRHGRCQRVLTGIFALSNTTLLHNFCPSRNQALEYTVDHWTESMVAVSRYCKTLAECDLPGTPLCPVVKQLAHELQDLEKEVRSLLDLSDELPQTKELCAIAET